MAVLIKAALGNHAIRKTGQGSGEKFGYGAPPIGSTLLVEADRRIWASSIRAGPGGECLLFSIAVVAGGFGCMAAVEAQQWDGLLLTYRHLCAKLVIAPPVNGENGGVHYED